METVKIVIELSEEDYKLALSRAALLGGILDKKLVDAVRSGRRIEENAIGDDGTLTSVNPQEPKTGHWIVGEKYYMGERNGCCSVCEDYYTNDWFEMKYCPNCGAKMVDPPESEVKE